MVPVKLPKEVLNLFPTWEYRCPCCGAYVESNKSFCPNCKTPFDEKRWRVPPRFLKSHDAMSEYAHKVLAPKLTPKQRERLFQYFTELFSDGFESGDFSAWTGTSVHEENTLEVQDTIKKCGTYASKHILAAGHIQDDSYCYKDLGATYTTAYMRLYVYIDSANLPGANRNFRFMSLKASTGAGSSYIFVALGVVSSSRYLYMTYRTTGGDQTDTSATALDLGQWYCVEVKFVRDASAGEVRVYLDGAEVEDLTHTGLNTTTWAGVQSVQAGSNNGWYNGDASAATFYTDCVVVADTYIGPETMEQTYTKTLATDALFKKLGITKTLSVDAAFQKQDIPKTFGLDAAFQKSLIIQNQIDALFKRFDIPKSFAVDARFGALITQTVSRQIDVLLKKLDATKTFGLDVYFGPVEAQAYAKTFALDVIFAYKVRLPELWLDENGKLVLNISEPYTWVGT